MGMQEWEVRYEMGKQFDKISRLLLEYVKAHEEAPITIQWDFFPSEEVLLEAQKYYGRVKAEQSIDSIPPSRRTKIKGNPND